MANAAFWFGLVRQLAEADEPIHRRMPFGAAATNFFAGAQYGLEARMWWPGMGELPVSELVLRRLLPLADEGLRRWQVDPTLRDDFLCIIERRCVAGQNGAAWQAASFHRRFDGAGASRLDALREMTGRYLDLTDAGEPVHTWPVD